MNKENSDVYSELGITKVISGLGYKTVLGGSILLPSAMKAIEESNKYFVEMTELVEKTGDAIAKLLGCEAVHVTPGAAAALALGSAGIIAGSDPKKIAQLPDTTGMKNDFLIQKTMRYRYDRLPTIVGGNLVEIGNEEKATIEDFESQIGENTAALYYLAMAQENEGIVPLEQIIKLGKKYNIPVLLDAAAEVYPVENMRRYPNIVDLVAFGGKYFGGPNACGFLAGKKELVEASKRHNHVAYETEGPLNPNGGSEPSGAFGRPLKLERQLVMGMYVALRDWLTMNHEERFQQEEVRARVIEEAVKNLPGVRNTVMKPNRWLLLTIQIDEKVLGKSVLDVLEALKKGNPSIHLANSKYLYTSSMENAIDIYVAVMAEGDEYIVAERLKEVLSE